MTKQKENSTVSSTGEMPWENLIDFSVYRKSQVKVKTIIYKVVEAVELLIEDIGERAV